MQKSPSFDGKLALWALTIFLVLVAVFVPSFILRQREERELRETRERFASAQVAERFTQLVSMRVRILELLAYTRSKLDDSERFTIWSQRIHENVQGFYAINWIDTRGVITTVVPEAQNAAALGRNLMERPELSPYLIRARDEKRPMMSHIVDLYQGPPGVVLYLPIYEGEVFEGWINGVFTADEIIGSLLLKGEFGSSYVSLQFKDKGDRAFVHGVLPKEWTAPTVYPFDALNQKVEVMVAPTLPPSLGSGRWGWVLLAFVAVTSLALSVFAYLLMLSRQRLEQRLQKERIQGVLLNLMVHDIINPLMIVRFGGETAQRAATPELKAPIEKVLYGVSQINEVIGRVKDLRAVEAGRFVPKLAPVAVNDVIEESFRMFESRLKAKELKPVFEPCATNPKIMVDRVIFQNNVLNNLISNAIKFSEKGGEVKVHCSGEEGKFVVMEVIDHGVGMSESIRAHLFLDDVDVSRPGTLGEKGTGIGMIQVKTYMRLFGGRAAVQSKAKISGAEDHGTTFRLFLPKSP